MSDKRIDNLTSDNIFSLLYHSFFEYPLTTLEMVKWQPGKMVKKLKIKNINYSYKNGYFFLEKSKGLIFTRSLRKRISQKKLLFAKKASNLLKKIPFIKLVAITGSLSMFNARDDSDIDLIVVTKKKRLWTTRLLSLLLLILLGIKVRRFKDKNEKNKICINMWFDESNLVWPKKDRNFYTAHEIVQVMPLFEKNKTYQKLLNKNAWVKDFWPYAVKISKFATREKTKKSLIGDIVENILFKLQKSYMRNKRTREIVRQNRAIFHPIDRSKIIIKELNKYLIKSYSKK